MYKTKFSNGDPLLKGTVGGHQSHKATGKQREPRLLTGSKCSINFSVQDSEKGGISCLNVSCVITRQPEITRTRQKRAATGKNPSRGWGVSHTRAPHGSPGRGKGRAAADSSDSETGIYYSV